MKAAAFKLPIALLLIHIGFANSLTAAVPRLQDHQHGAKQEIKRPKVYLDKNPRIVKYQLGRLDNEKLLLVERKDDDEKYLLVHEEILLRDGMSKGDRIAALDSISRINSSDNVAELLKIIPTLDGKKSDQQRIVNQLIRLLVGQDRDTLNKHLPKLEELTGSENKSLAVAGYAGLIIAERIKDAQTLATAKNMKSFLNAIPLVPNKKLRNELNPYVREMVVTSKAKDIQSLAIKTMQSMDKDLAADFSLLASYVDNPDTRESAVRVILKIPRKFRNANGASAIADSLVKFAESTPKEDRTTNSFIEAMQLADQLLGIIDRENAKEYRARLDEVSVRVVLIHTVDEEMRYDIPWFAVEAGRDIQIVLKNEDLMAHNLVVVVPDALQEVALDGAALGPKIGASGKQYVPVSDKVIAATDMIQAEKTGRITFTAPTEPGEYPYVCTFPGHWMRMYGVMVVVEDLAEFKRNPVEPKDPVGSNRPFVKAWAVEDLADKLDSGLRGRSKKIGQKIFNEATCALCHKVTGEGKSVGPELTDVWSRWKGDAKGILREVLDPSHKIDPKYIVRKIITFDGDVISGIVMAEDKDTISILPNPESKEPTVIKQDDIDDMVKSSVSIMPKALMDRFTEDEIFELMNYLKTVDPNN